MRSLARSLFLSIYGRGGGVDSIVLLLSLSYYCRHTCVIIGALTVVVVCLRGAVLARCGF